MLLFFSGIAHLIIPVAHAADASAATPSVTTLLGLDWKLFIAQLINVGIVVFVLWKWVFTPLGHKLEERSRTIAQSLAHAQEIEQMHADAETFKKSEMEKARKEASSIIEKSQVAAEVVKAQILSDATAASEKIAEQSKIRIAEEKKTMLQEVNEEVSTLVVAATEQILKEKLDAKKDAQMIKEALKSL